MHTLSPVACLVLGLTLAAPAMAQTSAKKGGGQAGSRRCGGPGREGPRLAQD